MRHLVVSLGPAFFMLVRATSRGVAQAMTKSFRQVASLGLSFVSGTATLPARRPWHGRANAGERLDVLGRVVMSGLLVTR
ncbi:hypothetical protein AB0I81_11220 [Nonomuraea sp. NPDC050404]|uniref:hypothetical protein n=1 Tax=Nonomuraea sp. NPDC050404 TaxID=3155783 RepID=UPI0033E0072E